MPRLSLSRLLGAAALALAALGVGAAAARADDVALLVETSPVPGDVLPVVVRTDRPGRVELTLVRLGSDAAAVSHGRIALTREQMTWLVDGPDARRAPARSPQQAFLQLVNAEVVERTTVETTAAGQRLAATLRPNAPGVHVVAARFGRAHALVPAVVSALGLVVKRHPEGALVWCVDRRSGKPWSGARLQREGDDTTYVAGRDGLVHMPDVGPGPLSLSALALDGGERGTYVHRAFGSGTWHPALPAGRRVHLATHQPAYRPGDVVEVRGIVRVETSAGMALDTTAATVALHLEDPQGAAHGSALAEVVAATGTFAGTLRLPAEARTGAWRVVATIDGETHVGPLQVEAWRRPPIETSVRVATSSVRPGQRVRAVVSAAWLTGGAVPGARVAWQALFTRVAPDPFPESELVRLFFGSERQAYRPETLATGSGRLAQDGTLAVELDVPAGTPDGFVALVATVEGPDRLHVTGRASLAVRATPWRLSVRTDRFVYGLEDQPRVELRLEAAEGELPAGLVAVVTLARLGTDGLETWAEPTPVRLGPHGRAETTVALGESGRYRILAAVTTPDGTTPAAHVELEAMPARITTGSPAPSLIVTADRSSYAPGDRARLLLRTSGDVPVALVTIQGQRLLDTRLVPLVDGTGWVEVALDERHAPDAYVAVTAIERGEGVTVTRLLRVPSAAPLLDVRVQPDVATARPGSEVAFDVSVRDHRGDPVAGADVSLAVVDDAQHQLFAAPAPALARFFHAPRRDEVATEAWFHVDASDRVVVAAPTPRKGERNGRAGRDRAEGGAEAPGADAGAPLGAPAAQDDGAPQPPESPPPTGAPAPEPSPDMEVLEESEGEAARSDDDAGGATTAGLGALEAKSKKGQDARAAALEAEVRKTFLAALHWSPHLRTDAGGRARVVGVRLADDLTRWRATAEAVDAMTRVGHGEATVVADLPLETRVTLPRFLRAGDVAAAQVVVRNRTADALADVVVETTWDGAGVGTEPAPAGSLAPGSAYVGTTTLEAGAVGTRTVEVRAGARTEPGATVADAEARSVPVHAAGVPRRVAATRRAASGRAAVEVTVPAGAVAGTWSGRVIVQPGLRRAVEDALPYLVDYPHGCTEQTMSRVVPLVVALASPWPGAGTPDTDERAIRERLQRGVARLEELRHADGGFGWWPGDASNVDMTALVLDGLTRLVAAGGGDVRVEALRQGAVAWLAAWLERTRGDEPPQGAPHVRALLALAEADRLDASWLAPAVSAWARSGGAADPLGTALLLRTALAARDAASAGRLAANLEDAAVRESDGQVWWRAEPGPLDRWERDPVHATAEAALALLEADGDMDLVRGAARWLLARRAGGTYWGSTRDTAAVVRMLVALAVRDGDPGQAGEVAISLGGQPLATLGAAGSFAAALPADALQAGARLEVGAVGASEGLYDLVVVLDGIEAGDALEAAANGISVQRTWWVIEPSPDGTSWVRTPLEESVTVGALVESEIVVSAANDLRYLMLTDPHVAGFESEDVVGVAVAGAAAATETTSDVQDDRTHDWVTAQPVGAEVRVRHRFRATHVGSWRALPAQAELMYYPDVAGRSRGEVIEVRPRREEGR
ncbi:MAG: alpha-2-macroglobulin [Planctomycetota bacterium]